MKNNRVNYWIFSTLILLGIVWSSSRSEHANSSPDESISQEDGKVYYTPPRVNGEYSFAGERVPTEQFEVYKRLDRELLSNSYFHSNTFLMVKRANRYFPIIDPILKAQGVPSDFKYLAVIESSLDPRAISKAGAAGLWQLMKGTAMDLGLEVNSEVDERYNIEKSTVAACTYFKQLYAKYSNWGLVAAAYNTGASKIDESIKKQKANNYYDLLLNTETKRYVFRIVALKSIIEAPIKFGFKLSQNDLYPLFKSNAITVDTAIANIADFAILNGTTYAELKELNPWLRDYTLTNKSKKSYTILLPLKVELSSVEVYNSDWIN